MAATSRTLRFTASTTQHITNLTVRGSSGHNMSVVSATPGTYFSIIKDGGGVFYGGDFATIQDCHIISPASWYAGHNSSDVSGNTNIILADFLVATLTDTVSLVESLQKSIVKLPFISTITLSETLAKLASYIRNLQDSITPVSTLSKETTKSAAEQITLTEVFTKAVDKFHTDSVSMVETLARAFTKTMNDTVNLIESLIKALQRVFIDISISGYYMTQEDGFRILQEDGNAIQLDRNEVYYPEVFIKSVGKNTLTDIITLIEHFINPFIRKYPRIKKLLQVKVDNILLEAKRRVTMLK